jgi:hypothetical protein
VGESKIRSAHHLTISMGRSENTLSVCYTVRHHVAAIMKTKMQSEQGEEEFCR